LTESLGHLCSRFGIDEIGHRFGLGEIHLAMFEGSPREFARFRRPDADGCQGFDHAFYNRTAAVEMKLSAILSRVTSGGREIQDKGLIQHPATMAEDSKGGLSWWDSRHAQGMKNVSSPGPGHPHNSDGAPPGGCSQGEDRIFHVKDRQGSEAP
jgi:hypothetical protein